MDNGFIKLHRKFLTWEWYQDTNTKILFLHLLLKANYKDNQWQGITIKRGEVIIGLISLSEELGLSIQQIRTSLKKLKSSKEITSQATNRFTIITIVNYNKYQVTENEATNETTNKQQTDNKQATTLKERKESKERKKYIYDHFEKFWNAYPKKVGKENAWKSFEKIKMTNELLKIILEKLALQIKQDSWKDKQYIPNPSTYLNQKRWEDEVILKEDSKIPSWMEKEIIEEKIELTKEEEIEYEQIINGTYGKETI